MANNTEVVFDNIEQRILQEIESAHYAIFVSVAWFTNKRLFQALLEKAKSNCYVSIIIQLDEINSQCGIDYNQIQQGRSECFMISKDAELLHDKFCVIDFRKVITGSYNWTYKASYNSENILILEDPSVATQYISRFEQQKAKLNASNIQKHPVVQSKSNDTVNKSQVNASIVSAPPTTKQCICCKKEIGYMDRFCMHCGNIQEFFLIKGVRYDGLIREAICKKCLCKQDENLIDAAETKYCTFCGSDSLDWKWSYKSNKKD